VLAAALHRRLDDWLAAVRDSRRYTVALLDEAHTLRDRRSLEAVRMLLSPSPGGERLVTVILAGQEELASRVTRFVPLNERIEVRSALGPLSEEEATSYLLRRIEIAGGRRGIFTRKGAAALAAAAGNLPGGLNKIAEACLVTASAAGLDRVGPDVVAVVLEDMKAGPDEGGAGR
jgi:type II secretory pathway predicted ATPase ExeA